MCQKPGKQSARKSSTARTSSGYSDSPRQTPFSANVSGAESSHLSATSGLISRTSTIHGISSYSTARASRRSKSSMSGRSWRHPKISFSPARATEAALAAHVQRGEIELHSALDSERMECRHLLSGLSSNIVVRVAMEYYTYSTMLEQDWDVCAHHSPSIRRKSTDTEVVREPSGFLHCSSCGCGA